MNHDRRWIWGAVLFTGILAWIGLADPAVALRAAVVAVLVIAALLLIRALAQLFDRVPPVDASTVAPVEPRLGATALLGHELPSTYSALAPTDPPSPVLGPGARSALRTIATERLWARHELNLWHADHEPLIADMLSERLWAIINPNQRTPPPHDAFDHARLGQHLDELDSL